MRLMDPSSLERILNRAVKKVPLERAKLARCLATATETERNTILACRPVKDAVKALEDALTRIEVSRQARHNRRAHAKIVSPEEPGRLQCHMCFRWFPAEEMVHVRGCGHFFDQLCCLIHSVPDQDATVDDCPVEREERNNVDQLRIAAINLDRLGNLLDDVLSDYHKP